ncbi:MAG: Abi-alpha family protein [Sciscionella sp.]
MRQDIARRGFSWLLTGAGSAANWLISTGVEATGRVPGGVVVRRGVRRVERAVLSELGDRIDRAHGVPGPAAADGRQDPLRSAMAELLERSVEVNRDSSLRALYGRILTQLTPDEARILAALAEGDRFPLIHVAARSRMGGTGRLTLANASTVGKVAGVAVPENTPVYLARLHLLGLVEFGEQDDKLSQEYDILLTDALVVDADDMARGARKFTPKFVRETVGISPLGSRFWQVCDPSSGRSQYRSGK